jgi:hypothetical protein
VTEFDSSARGSLRLRIFVFEELHLTAESAEDWEAAREYWIDMSLWDQDSPLKQFSDKLLDLLHLGELCGKKAGF